ncbi:MAG: hypothetical protein ACLQU4_05710 [Limisphaerales bacterium]
MRFLVGLVIVIGLSLGAYQLYEYWGNFKEKEPTAAAPVQPEVSGDELPGMVPRLQPVLDAARKRGALGLRDFLAMYGNTINDPRRAWIELDYVVLLAQSSPGEARREFAKVKSRVPPGSPVYNRVKQLEKTYE